MMKSGAYLGALFCASLVSSFPAQADFVVIESENNRLSVGEVVPDDYVLTLPDGAYVVLVAKSGAVERIEGPHSGSIVIPDGDDAGVVGIISDLLKSRGRGVAVLGAVRNGASQEAGRPIVNLLLGETICLESGVRPLMALPPRAEDQKVEFRGPEAHTVSWPASTAQIEWPTALPLQDRTRYVISVDGLEMGEVYIRILADQPGALGVRVARLAAEGCHSQALQLLSEWNG